MDATLGRCARCRQEEVLSECGRRRSAVGASSRSECLCFKLLRMNAAHKDPTTHFRVGYSSTPPILFNFRNPRCPLFLLNKVMNVTCQPTLPISSPPPCTPPSRPAAALMYTRWTRWLDQGWMRLMGCDQVPGVVLGGRTRRRSTSKCRRFTGRLVLQAYRLQLLSLLLISLHFTDREISYSSIL